ncbi:tRNA (guanosine(46)-N7)-methyltransferase TrmB [Sulfurimonas diazotrophicus]|uniref:tRNA (guanine-N(7)-)-methyltransferase n=1 Tax=Sulfurimonas diazotrophicus TaxID=3131939 RepID=A0ABZ3HDF5_9BACT
MPHLHIASFKAPAFPAAADGVTFHYMAENTLHDDEKLIAASIGEKEFFLLLKRLPDKTLLKADKISRPSATHYVKRALQAYAGLVGLEVLASNVDSGEANMHLGNDSALWSIHDFERDFPTDREIRIEVGFGSGRHLLHQAKANPEVLFIGIEIHKPSIEQVLKQINIQQLDNILLLDYDARLFLELVPSNLAGRIYVHFPVPWDKKPHRRVIGEAFIAESIRVLKPEGKLELRTDSDNYFAYSFETFMALNQNHIEIYKNRALEVSSKYEDRWRRMEKNIYDVLMHNEELSGPLEAIAPFAFNAIAPDPERLEALNGSTLRFDEGFVHFERLYRTDDGRAMFRLSMGPYARPEHLYLILGDAPRYLPTPPVRSRTNARAHQLLIEALHG